MSDLKPPEGVILIGGLVGAGKSSLAEGVSNRLELPCYSVDEAKKIIYREDPDYDRNIAYGIPFSEETRNRTYEYALRDLADLAVEHGGVVVEETLSRRSSRQLLYEGVSELFGKYIVVEVVLDETTTRERLEASREGHMLTDPMSVYHSLAAAFDPLTEADIVFSNDRPLDESVDSLTQLVVEHF